MADEITVTTGLKVVNGNLSFNSPATARKFDQTTADRGGGPGTVNVGTTEETISFGDHTLPAFVQMVNNDATNYVEVGFATGVYPLRLIAGGGPMLLYVVSGTTVYVKANTAACDIQVNAVTV